MGDSGTFGYKVPRSKTWSALVQKQTGIEMINCGVTGDTTGGMLARFGPAVQAYRPQAALIMGGVNDFITGAPPGAVQANLAAMCHQAMAWQIIPVLGVPAPVRTSHVRDDWRMLADFDEVERKLCELRRWVLLFSRVFHVDVVDLFPFFSGEAAMHDQFYQSDGIHLTAEGNRVLADIMCRCLRGFFWFPAEPAGG